MEEERIYNKIQVVDENDNLLGIESYFDALEKGCIRRASRVFVFNEDGHLLVQQRGRNVAKPFLFDQSVGGHVDEGETYYDAAIREMEEEIGLTCVPIEEIATSFRDVDFFNAIYRTTISNNIEINFDKKEVEAVFWMTIEEVDTLTANASEKCTEAFVLTWNEFRDKLIQNK